MYFLLFGELDWNYSVPSNLWKWNLMKIRVRKIKKHENLRKARCCTNVSVFARQKKKQLSFRLNCLVFSVDQLGLEPRTSRLWVCCSNQLSYKSDADCRLRHCAANLGILAEMTKYGWRFCWDPLFCALSFVPLIVSFLYGGLGRCFCRSWEMPQ